MVEKSKKKHKKSKTNEVTDAVICETERQGNDIGIEGFKHSDKEDANRWKDDERREKEKKKKKKKKVREDSFEGIVERKKVNEEAEVGEHSGGGDQAGDFNGNREERKKKKDKDKPVAGSCHQQHNDVENAEGVPDGDPLVKVGKKKRKREKDKYVLDEGEGQKAKSIENGSGDSKSKKSKTNEVTDVGICETVLQGNDIGIEGCKHSDKEDVNRWKDDEGREKEKKKKKKNKVREDSFEGIVERKKVNEEAEVREHSGGGDQAGNFNGNLEKKKKKRDKDKTVAGSCCQQNEVETAEGVPDGGPSVKVGKKKRKREKDKYVLDEGKGQKEKSIGNGSQDSRFKKSPKKVRFSTNVEVFPPSKAVGNGNGKNEDTLVRGKRFSKEEDEIVRQAVFNYIEENCLGDEGLKMVLNCRSHPQVRNCWKEIGSAIPYRPYVAVYHRAQVLFRRSKDRKWTQEECDTVMKFYNQHGAKWKVLADELGKHRWHVKDTWRRIKLANKKKGRWDQEEYQTLFDLVNKDLVMRLSEEKKTKHGMLRDNIPWSAISDKLSTRSVAVCCLKWYNQLTSPMVSDGKWSDADDYRLINALYELDASCIEDVNWDNLLDHRSGDVCLKRWKQMVLHIGQHATKSFAEQVEVLANRYCPNLLNARVAWDDKPVVP